MPRRPRYAVDRRNVAGPAVRDSPAGQGTLVRGGGNPCARAGYRSHELGVHRVQRGPRPRPAGRRPGPHHDAGDARRRRARAGDLLSRLPGLARRGDDFRGHRRLQRAGNERRRPGHGDRGVLRSTRHGERVSPARHPAADRPQLSAGRRPSRRARRRDARTRHLEEPLRGGPGRAGPGHPGQRRIGDRDRRDARGFRVSAVGRAVAAAIYGRRPVSRTRHETSGPSEPSAVSRAAQPSSRRRRTSRPSPPASQRTTPRRTRDSGRGSTRSTSTTTGRFDRS